MAEILQKPEDLDALLLACIALKKDGKACTFENLRARGQDKTDQELRTMFHTITGINEGLGRLSISFGGEPVHFGLGGVAEYFEKEGGFTAKANESAAAIKLEQAQKKATIDANPIAIEANKIAMEVREEARKANEIAADAKSESVIANQLASSANKFAEKAERKSTWIAIIGTFIALAALVFDLYKVSSDRATEKRIDAIEAKMNTNDSGRSAKDTTTLKDSLPPNQ